jgi:hypothetical protein
MGMIKLRTTVRKHPLPRCPVGVPARSSPRSRRLGRTISLGICAVRAPVRTDLQNIDFGHGCRLNGLAFSVRRGRHTRSLDFDARCALPGMRMGCARCPPTSVPLGFVKPFIRLTLESSPAGVPRLRREREYQCLRSLQGLRGRVRAGIPFGREAGHADLVRAVRRS